MLSAFKTLAPIHYISPNRKHGPIEFLERFFMFNTEWCIVIKNELIQVGIGNRGPLFNWIFEVIKLDIWSCIYGFILTLVDVFNPNTQYTIVCYFQRIRIVQIGHQIQIHLFRIGPILNLVRLSICSPFISGSNIESGPSCTSSSNIESFSSIIIFQSTSFSFSFCLLVWDFEFCALGKFNVLQQSWCARNNRQ